MRETFPDVVKSLFITLLTLFILEVFNTTIMPLFGMARYNLAFNILIVLFIGFKVESTYQALYIFIVQYFHSFFSVEGWEIGTIAGIIICIIISYMKEILHFVNFITTIFVTFIFQFIWFAIVSGLLYLKTENLDYIADKFWRFIVEGLLIAFLAPWFFSLFDKVWKVDKESSLP